MWCRLKYRDLCDTAQGSGTVSRGEDRDGRGQGAGSDLVRDLPTRSLGSDSKQTHWQRNLLRDFKLGCQEEC